MTGDELEQIKRILDPAVRETVRDVLEDVVRPFSERLSAVEAEMETMRQIRGKVLVVWTGIAMVATLIGKALWENLISPLINNRN